MSSLALILTCYAIGTHAAGTEFVSETFPVIDLGYAHHAPTKINTTLNNITYATYSNIRFAQPPVGDLRFRGPQTPPPYSNGVQDGVYGFNETNCVQSIPSYFDFLPGLNGTSWGQEDCLFLDVIVPEGVVQGNSVPVLHWIYGGGFFYGAKDNGGNPAALLRDIADDEKFIIVASNYRLGSLGWMASSDETSIDANAGFYDTLAALEWTRDNVHRFGGDGNRVTVMGQSAGGGIITHILALSAEGQRVLFNQAILSSPGHRPHVNRSEETTDLWHQFLNLTNCSDAACARSLDESVVAEANRYFYIDAIIDGFPGPSISFSPVLDGNLIKDLPERTFENSIGSQPAPSYVKRVIAGGMKNDGAASTIGDFTSWLDQLSIFARTPSQSTISLVESLYGSFNGSASSFQEDGSVSLTPFDEFSGDLIYACHSQLSAKTFSSKAPNKWPGLQSESYRYEMSLQPAVHGQDLNYYFYDDVIAAADPTTDAEVAGELQRHLRRFILGHEMLGWPEYSSSGLDAPTWMNITAEGFETVVGADETDLGVKCEELVKLFDNDADGW